MFRKVWFSTDERKIADREFTAGLILDTNRDTIPTTITGVSKLFPYYECRKMVRFGHADFETWEEAFAFDHTH